jgi:hypothetical protein
LSSLPLQSTLEHLDDLADDIDSYMRNIARIPYPRVRSNLETAGRNYRNGLRSIKDILNLYFIPRARELANLPRTNGSKEKSTDEIIRKHWGRQLNISYHIAEGFRSNFALSVEAQLPWELYYLVFDIFDQFAFGEKIVFRPGEQFMTESFQKTVMEPLQPLLQVGREPILPGRLETGSTFPDIGNQIKIEPAHTITYVSGEARNPLLWPLLIHESFHLLDDRLGLFIEMEQGIPRTPKLPLLSESEQVNRAWAREIFQDVLAVHYFGPLYAFSLMKYFERLPYIKTIEHPEMFSRLYAVSRYLQTVESQYTDFLQHALNFCKPPLLAEISKHETSDELNGRIKGQLDMFYDSVTTWLRSKQIILFTHRLRKYVEESSRSGQMIEVSEIDQIPYVDPIFTFKEVVDLVFEHKVPLALDPIIMLNLLLSASAGRSPQGFYQRFVKCMSNWCIKKAWSQALSNIKSRATSSSQTRQEFPD